jgi:hypothetical protein
MVKGSVGSNISIHIISNIDSNIRYALGGGSKRPWQWRGSSVHGVGGGGVVILQRCSIFGEIRQTVAELWVSASGARGGELIYFIVGGGVGKAFATVPFSTQFLQEVVAKSMQSLRKVFAKS